MAAEKSIRAYTIRTPANQDMDMSDAICFARVAIREEYGPKPDDATVIHVSAALLNVGES
jgi:hypothetical protein